MALLRKIVNKNYPVLPDQELITPVYGTRNFRDKTIVDVPSMVFKGPYSLQRQVLAVRAQVKNFKGTAETALLLDRKPHLPGAKRPAVVSGDSYDYIDARAVENLFSTDDYYGSKRMKRLRYVERKATELKIGAAASVIAALGLYAALHGGSDMQPMPQPEQRGITGSIGQLHLTPQTIANQQETSIQALELASDISGVVPYSGRVAIRSFSIPTQSYS